MIVVVAAADVAAADVAADVVVAVFFVAVVMLHKWRTGCRCCITNNV